MPRRGRGRRVCPTVGSMVGSRLARSPRGAQVNGGAHRPPQQPPVAPCVVAPCMASLSCSTLLSCSPALLSSCSAAAAPFILSLLSFQAAHARAAGDHAAGLSPDSNVSFSPPLLSFSLSPMSHLCIVMCHGCRLQALHVAQLKAAVKKAGEELEEAAAAGHRWCLASGRHQAQACWRRPG